MSKKPNVFKTAYKQMRDEFWAIWNTRKTADPQDRLERYKALANNFDRFGESFERVRDPAVGATMFSYTYTGGVFSAFGAVCLPAIFMAAPPFALLWPIAAVAAVSVGLIGRSVAYSEAKEKTGLTTNKDVKYAAKAKSLQGRVNQEITALGRKIEAKIHKDNLASEFDPAAAGEPLAVVPANASVAARNSARHEHFKQK